jgi:hypothetical protein
MAPLNPPGIDTPNPGHPTVSEQKGLPMPSNYLTLECDRELLSKNPSQTYFDASLLCDECMEEMPGANPFAHDSELSFAAPEFDCFRTAKAARRTL